MITSTLKIFLKLIGLGPESSLRQWLVRFFWKCYFDAERWKFVQKIICRRLGPHYASVIRDIRERVSRGEPVRVGFMVTMDTIFPLEPLFKMMLKDPAFEPYIIVAAQCTYGKEFEIEHTRKSWTRLAEKYGTERVLRGFDWETDTYTDYSPQLDMAGFNYPYPVTYPYFGISYLHHERVLTFSTEYGLVLSRTHYPEVVLPTFFMHALWKFYATTPTMIETARRVMFNQGRNMELTGFLRMDAYRPEPPKKEGEKKIVILAPHHSMYAETTIRMSNFLDYAELFQKLPEMYPQIQFVFRPHPYLLIHLVKMNVWTQEEVDRYMERLAAHPNMEIALGGDHLPLFAKSDGMIQDCVSFLAEYFYTGKPQCYMMCPDGRSREQLNDLGRACLDHTYPAHCEQDILEYLDNVILKGEDPQKEERDRFAKENIMLNWPNVTEKILDSIKSELGCPKDGNSGE